MSNKGRRHTKIRRRVFSDGRPSIEDVIVDPEDAHFLDVRGWYVTKPRKCNTWYAVRNIWEPVHVCVYLHRLIMNAPPGSIVDHINRNGLDNRKENLRLVTRQQNIWNVGPGRRNKSGVVGVHWEKSSQRWRSMIRHNGVVYNLGTFDTLEEGHAAYRKKIVELRGEYAPIEVRRAED